MAQPLTPDDPVSLGGYRLAGRLGEGGQGVVYLAHASDGEPVAVKLLSTGDKETRARLAREIDALESIASFCTARVIDVSADGPRPFVVSEFVDGPSLAERVRDRGPLRGGDLERLVVGTATALAAIHAAGVVHRDFKPANVLLGPDGPRVVDFGIARAEGPSTMTSGLIGTPAYLAPEQIAGSPASAASDVFAWAASMVYAATGTSPFGADTVPAVLHRVLQAEPDLSALPPGLRELIASCLAKDPSRRPTAQQLMLAQVNPRTPRPAQSTGPSPQPTGSGPQGPGPHSPGPHSPGPHNPGPHNPGSQGLGPPGSGPQRPVPGPMPSGSMRPGSGPGPVGAGWATGPQGAAETAPGRRSRTRGVLIGAVAATAIALGAAGATALYLNRSPITTSESPATQQAQTGPPATAQEPVQESPAPEDASPAPTPEESGDDETPTSEPGLKIPAAFDGTWEGHTTSTNPLDTDGAENRVELKEGESTASWSEKDQDDDCKGTITLTKVEKGMLTFSLAQNEGGCIPGTITLALEGDTLAYTWQDVPGPGIVTQTGSLNKN